MGELGQANDEIELPRVLEVAAGGCLLRYLRSRTDGDIIGEDEQKMLVL